MCIFRNIRCIVGIRSLIVKRGIFCLRVFHLRRLFRAEHTEYDSEYKRYKADELGNANRSKHETVGAQSFNEHPAKTVPDTVAAKDLSIELLLFIEYIQDAKADKIP